MQRRSIGWLCGALCASALLSTPSSASANGRFPRAERLVENPKNANELWLGATYGLLVTRDRGKNWWHVCEAGFARNSEYLGDPLIGFASGGALAVSVQSTLNMSLDGCQWTPTLGGIGIGVLDYAIAPSSPSTILAALADGTDGGVTNVLEESTDNGATWRRIGVPLPVDVVYTVDVAPDDPAHLYATGLHDKVGQWLTSSDHGTTWTVSPIPGTSLDERPYIAGVHPLDPKRIFVRTDGWTQGQNATEVANDALLYTDDEGLTWKELFRNQAKLFGFALSPDGSEVLIGFGDPKGFQEFVTGPLGVFRSATAAFAFEAVFRGNVVCLAWTKTGVYVCGSQEDERFELAFSPVADLSSDGGCLTPLLRLNEVRGPLACPPSTSSATCADNWATACATLGACEEAGASTPGPSCIAVDGGGAAPIGGSPPSTGSPDAGSVPKVARAGCGCRAAPSRSTPGASLVWLLGLAAACRRRARRLGSQPAEKPTHTRRRAVRARLDPRRRHPPRYTPPTR